MHQGIESCYIKILVINVIYGTNHIFKKNCEKKKKSVGAMVHEIYIS